MWYVLVCTSILKYVAVHTGTYMVCASEWCESTGFQGKHRDAALRDMVRPYHMEQEQEQEQGDPDVPPEDEGSSGHSFNPKVSHTVSYLAHVSTYCCIPSVSKKIQVYTSTYWSS
jgi:hypothetical protein